jgi:hypothetical protein
VSSRTPCRRETHPGAEYPKAIVVDNGHLQRLSGNSKLRAIEIEDLAQRLGLRLDEVALVVFDIEDFYFAGGHRQTLYFAAASEPGRWDRSLTKV